MIQIGQYNTLTIMRDTPVGMYLGENEHDVVLLPKKYIKPEFKVGDSVEVFVYRDSEDRPIATTLRPYAKLYEFACLTVNHVSNIGAFLDWGLEKDLLVPFKEQKHPMQEGYSYVVYVYLDEVTDRIVASNKINRFVSNEVLTVKQGDEVDLLVYNKNEIGYHCIINNSHKGLLYRNEVYQPVQIGDRFKGYIKLIRETQQIDLSLQKPGFKNVLSSTDLILQYLEEHDGFLHLHDKSTPEEIANLLNMSKATYKKSIGVLYRHRKIRIEENGVYLIKESKQ